MNFNLTLVGQVISLAIFVFICMQYIWPYIIKGLKERETKIADGLAAAEKGRHDLELAGNRAIEIIREGKEKSQDYIAQAQKRADEIVDEAKDNAKVEGDHIIASASAEIDQERQQVREELRQQVAVLAVAGAEQILAREVDEKAHKEVLDKISATL